MGGWGHRLLLALIVGLTAFSIITVWPSEPNRYLPDFIPWPEGKGIKFPFPTIEGGTFGLTTIERRAMSLGLDLRGGTRLVLAPEEGFEADEAALEGAQRVIERRVNAFGVAETEVNKLGSDRISVALPGIKPEEAIDKIGRTALLQFCEAVKNETGNVAIVRTGTVTYQPQSCEPVRDPQGNVVVEGGSPVEFVPLAEAMQDTNLIVWQPARGELEGEETALTGEFLEPNTFVDQRTSPGNPLGQPILLFQWKGDGAELSEQITERLSRRVEPLAVFLDGQPIRGEGDKVIAPVVRSTITSQGTIEGLSVQEARELSTLLNTGAFPVPLQVVQQQDVDATLGDTAVRNSVIAGQVALLVIMLFMIVHYRLPGLLASLALIVYTSFLLAIFKLWPVTLTLAGIAAFVLSVGMAVDANILIFERMKEELRVGRALRAAMEDGFHRAWSSIRDSNISTLITCVILYWFGSQFGESAVKGFALTLAIGVLLSMFSAIIVSRAFLLLVVSSRWVSRRLWLFIADLPEEGRRAGPAPAPVTGGSGEE